MLVPEQKLLNDRDEMMTNMNSLPIKKSTPLRLKMTSIKKSSIYNFAQFQQILLRDGPNIYPI